MATNLQAGDISILGYNATNPDTFAFVSHVWIEAGTQIKFTDNGWLTTNVFATNEGIATWTAAADIPPGTVINSVSNAAQFTGATAIALATNGDQLIAYTGPEATPNFLHAVHSNGTTWDATTNTPQQSALPTELVDDQTGISVGSFANVQYNNSTTSGTIAAMKAAINNVANWTGSASAQTQATANLTVTAAAVTGTAANNILTTSGAGSLVADVHAYNGAGGTDTVDYSGSINRLTLNLSDATGLSNTHAAYRDTFTSIERFKLTSFNDTFVGSTGDDIVLDAGGADAYDGGAGTADEVSYEDAASAVTVNLTDVTGNSNAGWALGDTYANVEKFRLSSHNDTFIGSNASGFYNWASGENGNDTFTAGALGTTNTFWGGNGDDTFNGSDGTMTVRAGAGVDTLVGGSGKDSMYGDADNDVLNGNGGGDFLRGGQGDDDINGGLGNDQMYGDEGLDEIIGDAGLDVIYGGSGNDVLSGGADNDKIYGDADNDTIDGGQGADMIRGGAGDDRITGGDGKDTMYGEAGADTFAFAAGQTGADYIYDFEVGVDSIEFSGVAPASVTGLTNAYGNAVITWGGAGTTITVAGVTWDAVQADFVFL
jgi:Ca2+-binding RTX toxin-like protein